MRCEVARDRVLIAEPRELEGVGPSELASHLRACRECRKLAERILEEERALNGVLQSLAVARYGDRSPAEGSKSSRHRLRFLRWVPLAAAAALAAIVFGWSALDGPGGVEKDAEGGRQGAVSAERARGLGGGRPGASSAGSDRLAVRVPEDRQVAVFETSDPSVMVVWFF